MKLSFCRCSVFVWSFWKSSLSLLLIADNFGWCSQTLKLNLAALKLAREVPFVLYEALPEFQDSIPEQKRGVKNQMVRCS